MSLLITTILSLVLHVHAGESLNAALTQVEYMRDKVIPTAVIFTMNCPKDYMQEIGYPPILEENTKIMADIFGYSETLYACNTYQFNDYSRYDFNLFSEEEKRKYRDEHFATDLQNAYELGKRLVGKCTEE